jgi:3-dehydro-4-phosphotetronate decarboxylase
MNHRKEVLELQVAGKFMVEQGLTWGNAGNISVRTEPERCLISASGSNLGCLAPEDLVDCSFVGGETYARRPSKELLMHAAVYEERPEIQAVLHGAPFYATLIACADLNLPNNWFVENMYYLERTARVSYDHPGSLALADGVRRLAGNANILLLENHGVLVYDINLNEALMALQTLEVVARMVLEARTAGLVMKELPPERVADFMQYSGYRAPRSWKEAGK